MKTRLLSVSPDSPEPAVLREAADVLRAGGLVAFPTETVYGLGADALNAEAVRRIYEAKGRPSRNPVIVHVRSMEQARELAAHWSPVVEALAERYWPGPITFVVKKHSCVPDIVTAGRDTVALRCPSHAVAMALLKTAGCPIAAPSANLSEQLSPTTAQHVLQSLDGRIDLVLDGGPAQVGLESTIVDMTTQPPRLLRPGAITVDALCDACGPITIGAASIADNEAFSSPGQMARHYAPRTRLICCEGAAAGAMVEAEVQAGRRVGWLRWTEERSVAATAKGNSIAAVMDMPADAASYAARLYAALHELDAARLDLIVATLPPDSEIWRAVRDRLLRAAGTASPSTPAVNNVREN
ncbi:MAG: threonylcarbamoyl-AMP synthase [Phycisphaerae bacterium]|nr:MAG: threonylcarbamoyl-AMP synthase [Planctomycetia bacterium]GJQ28022.1 MAG: threonylcarbamoyl-AMP synthase [Phycisphaerae bacterium]